MKVLAILVLLLACGTLYGNCSSTQDGRITEVINKLQEMMDDIRAEGISDRLLYAKFKCYCDHTTAAKKAEIKDLKLTISMNEGKIEEALAENGILSIECEKLKASLTQLSTDQGEQTTIRDNDHGTYTMTVGELTQGIGNLNAAIEVLSKANGDQTQTPGADNTEYLKTRGADVNTIVEGNNLLGTKYSFLQVQSYSALRTNPIVKKALAALRAFVDPKHQQIVESFLQGDQPMASKGTYTSQGAEITGMLLNMRDTLQAQLTRADDEETTDVKTYTDTTADNEKRRLAMQALWDDKENQMGLNDNALALARSTISTATASLNDAEGFLGQVTTQCELKKNEYDSRVISRQTEEHAISEAIKILNSDEAFDTFRKITATSFLQIGQQQDNVHLRRLRRAADSLMSKASPAHRASLSKIAKMIRQVPMSMPAWMKAVEADTKVNQFKVVFTEIEKMSAVIDKEEQADVEQKSWCDSERTDYNAIVTDRTSVITSKEVIVGELGADISAPQTGLEYLIANLEADLKRNIGDQTSQTTTRKEAHVAYQKEIATSIKALAILDKAIAVLKKVEHWQPASFLQLDSVAGRHLRVRRVSTDPTAPATMDQASYEGAKTKGNDVITLLESIKTETIAEEHNEHEDEQEDQHAYEDSMAALKLENADLSQQLVERQAQLLQKKRDLKEESEALATARKEKASAETYLEKIRPGCDFITANLQARQDARVQEKTALAAAVTALKNSPAYQAFVRGEEIRGYGNCQEQCTAAHGDQHVICKACLAKVSVPGYCTSYPSTTGC